MEMISYIVVGIASIIVGGHALLFLDRKLRTIKPEVKTRPLTDPEVRSELSGFLRKHMVHGDADIRDGVVVSPVSPDRLSPLALTLGRASALLTTMSNRESDALYVRDGDRGYRLTGLDLSDVVEAASVIHRVAEDRHKSRSLYKGMTEEEVKRMTRAGLSQWLKDDGSFPESNEVMMGLWDNRPEFLMAQNVLNLAFSVKGARND